MPFVVFVAIAVVTAAARLPLEHGLTTHRVLELFLLHAHALVVIVGLGACSRSAATCSEAARWQRVPAGLPRTLSSLRLV